MADQLAMTVVRHEKRYPRPVEWPEDNRRRARDWRARKSIQELRAIGRNQRDRARLKAIMLLGGRCERCGINDSRVLQIDHLAGGGVQHRKTLASADDLYRHVMRNPADFQLLCANDNWIKRWEQKETQRRKD